MRGDRDVAKKSRGDSHGNSLAVTLNCLAGDWIDRTALAAFWLIPQLQSQLASEATNSATSLKQAAFGHLREF
jgi:hypothetical protein